MALLESLTSPVPSYEQAFRLIFRYFDNEILHPGVLTDINPAYAEFKEVRPHLWLRDGFFERLRAENADRIFMTIDGGPAVGKTRLSSTIMKPHAVTSATRPMRPGERDGIDYHFVKPDPSRNWSANDVFRSWINDGLVAEYTRQGADYKGVLFATLDKTIQKTNDIAFVVVDANGAKEYPRLMKTRYGLPTRNIKIMPEMTMANYFTHFQQERMTKFTEWFTESWRFSLLLEDFINTPNYTNAIIGNSFEENGFEESTLALRWLVDEMTKCLHT